MSLVIALIGIIVGLLFYAVRHRLNYWNRRGIQHDVPSFPKGNLADWPSKKQLGMVFAEYYTKYKHVSGPFVGFYFLLSKAVIVTDLDLVKRVLIKDFNHFENRGLFHNEVDDPLSATLVSIEGQKWRHLRHKLTPTFTSGKMKHMLPLILKVGEEMAKVFNDKLATPQVLEVNDLVSRFTADVIGTCAFGLDCNSQRNPNADFVTMGRKAITKRRYYGLLDFILFGFPTLARRLRLKSTIQEVEDFYFRIIKDTVHYRLKSKEKRGDFMDMLIEMYQKQQDGNTDEGLTFEELAAQAFIFFIAGFETSSTTMGFALYELAQNQDVQDKLRAEINEVLSKNNNQFSYENIKLMPYLEQVVMETLRKYPVLAHLLRVTNKDFSHENPKYNIEKGTSVIIPAIGIHYNPDIYPEPEKFKPERFTDEEIAARPACTWLPFGDGPRNCIGSRFGLMQSCVGLAYLIKDFRFSVSPQTQIPMKFITANILLEAENGIHLKVEKI